MLPSGSTLAPIIIATDKTQLTQFSGNKKAYPVYLTLGNLPKSIRRKPSKRACILIAYLSVDKIKQDKLTNQEHRSRNQRLFHESMRLILEPLRDAGRNGVDMCSGDGAVRKVHPVLACYVADYPEQCLVTCAKYGTCPKCQVHEDALQDMKPLSDPRSQHWTTSIIHDAMSTSSTPSQFYKTCMNLGVSGSLHRPFWQDFPFTDVNKSMTPDVLHQLHQGVLKHLISWCQRAMSQTELDRRIRSLPPSYGVRHFKNGISALSQISGSERKNMAKILLGCLRGALPKKGLLAVKSILDFIYLAQYSTHDNTTLQYMEDALSIWEENQGFFVEDTGIRNNLNIPKFHSLLHYIESIRLFGTTDNYNSEMFERLHIDFAKQGWRASNKRDEFPQMISWLSCQEKIDSFESYLSGSASMESGSESGQQLHGLSRISVAKFPNYPNKSIANITKSHQAPAFERHLKEYLNRFLDKRTSNHRAMQYPLPFKHLDVFNQFKFCPFNLQDDEEEERDIVKAIPVSKRFPSGRFDTVIVLRTDNAESTGLTGESYLN